MDENDVVVFLFDAAHEKDSDVVNFLAEGKLFEISLCNVFNDFILDKRRSRRKTRLLF